VRFYFERPWGKYDILYESDECKVKIINVHPGERLSLQSHDRRQESWTIVSGTGKMVLGEDEIDICSGDNIIIDKGQKHRVESTGINNLVFIEVQTGEYFGEDDIVRYEDDYGRLSKEQDDA
jgi:mannose-6-phosphate isomerase-like protein (cupin superfamily)